MASGLPCCRLLSSSPPAGASARHRPGSATGRALLRPAALGVTARRAPPQRPAPAFCRFCSRHAVARAASRRPFTGTRMAESASAMTPDAASERNQLLLGSLPCTYRPSGQTRSQSTAVWRTHKQHLTAAARHASAPKSQHHLDMPALQTARSFGFESCRETQASFDQRPGSDDSTSSSLVVQGRARGHRRANQLVKMDGEFDV